MRSDLLNYAVLPSVVKADTESAVTIKPLGKNVAFTPGETYRLTIMAVSTTAIESLPAEYSCVPEQDGSIKLTHFFAGEQQHVITIRRPKCDDNTEFYDITHRVRAPGNALSRIYIYSLEPDLYGLRPCKTELHCHTIGSDGLQDAAHTVGNYRAAGFDMLAITDHYVMQSSLDAIKLFCDMPVSMTLIPGEEVHLPTERIHAVNIGGDSVNEFFRQNRQQAEKEMKAIKDSLTLPADVPAEEYAWHVWIARKTAELGGLSLLTHPHWIWNDIYFIKSAVTEQLLRDGIYDALELVNNTEVDTTVALWGDMRAQGLRIPVAGSSDSHNTDQPDVAKPVHGYSFVFLRERTFEALSEAVRGEYCVAVDHKNSSPQLYGSFRMVKYARFILNNFMPVYQRYCQPQGWYLANWENDSSHSAVELLRELDNRAEAFVKGFFGK